ncbi:MAG TPA: hypothetical protein VGM91_06570 [Conexibacter sp.]
MFRGVRRSLGHTVLALLAAWGGAAVAGAPTDAECSAAKAELLTGAET